MHIDFKSERHTKYREYEDMFQNYEDDWQKIRKLSNSFEHPYLPIALPREVSTLYSDLAFGNPINTTVKDNDEASNAIDEIIEDNELDLQLSEASLSQSYKGGIVAKNYLDKGKSRITFIEPDYYFPVVSPTDKRKILYEVVAIPFDQSGKPYIYTEKYEDRNGVYWCVSQTFHYKNGKIGKEINEAEEVNTKLTQSPLTYIPFTRTNGSFWGESIYTGLTPNFDELNHRVTQISNVLDIHSDPAMWAVSGLFDEDGNIKRKGNKVYEVDEDSNGVKEPMGYITWNAQLEANFQFIEDIVFKSLSYVSPLAPALYGMDSTSQASGRAILLKSWRSQCKITRSYQYWRPALKKILHVAQQLQVISGEKNYTPAIPKIELVLNLPIDFYETTQNEAAKVDAGLSSKKSAIARLNPSMNNKQVEEEFQEIIEEQNQANQQTFMTDMLGMNTNTNKAEDVTEDES
ncbi:phage portal protein [Gracilibacillus saliphilus]|uniref:phage portal protein n=1 Tax=Gracilibacillus saliphilus TaxID=543890 RepID=UPI0013D2D424|nr:phage portal protein [Gracilibacillus saliphilus]